MQRPPDFRASHEGFFSPYRYGDRKWEDYLLDTQTFIYDAGREQVEAVERVGRQAMEQRDRQMVLLQDFIADAEGAWDRVSSQLDALTDELVTGFSALSYQLRYHGELLQQIVDRMGHIAKNIANPLATQANELLRSGQHLMQRGLYGEAYNDFIAAESKRSVDPMLHLCLTQLHYKVRDEGVPFDLAAAERHANLAIRYATSLRDDLKEDGSAVVDLVYRTAAHLALVKGGDLSKSEGPKAGAVELHRADGFLRQIDKPSPSSQFLHAQVLALLEQPNESLAKIRVLADFTRSWIPRALLEPNLETIADRVRALGADLRTTPGVHSRNVYGVISACREIIALCTAITASNVPNTAFTEALAFVFQNSNVEELSSAAAELSVRSGEIERDFEAGAIDAVSAASTLQGVLDSAKKRTLALLTTAVDELDAERKQATKMAELHAGRAKSMLADEHRRIDIGIIWFSLFLGGAVGCLVGSLLSRAGILNGYVEFRGASILGAAVGATVLMILALALHARITHRIHRHNRTAIPAQEDSAMRAREQASLITRRVDDLKRIRDALGSVRSS